MFLFLFLFLFVCCVCECLPAWLLSGVSVCNQHVLCVSMTSSCALGQSVSGVVGELWCRR